MISFLKKHKKHILVCTAAALLAVIGIGASAASAGYKKIEAKIDEKAELVQPVQKEEVRQLTNENVSEETKEVLKENWLIAGFGIDSRSGDIKDGGNSDVIMIASVNNKTGAIKLVSVYRDTCLKTGKKRYGKANEAYARGGPAQAVEMLNECLDMEIDDYISVNWKAVATAINILGGVDIEVTKAELRWINGYITETVNSTGIGSVQLKSPGLQHLDGVQAVAYARIRYTAGDDFRRTERQRDVLKAMLGKARKADPGTLEAALDAVLPMTASSIGAEDIRAALKNILKYRVEDTAGFPSKYKEGISGGADYVFPKDLAAGVSELHEFLFGVEDYEPSDAVKEISRAIEEKYRAAAKARETEAPAEEPSEPAMEEALPDASGNAPGQTETPEPEGPGPQPWPGAMQESADEPQEIGPISPGQDGGTLPPSPLDGYAMPQGPGGDTAQPGVIYAPGTA